MDSVIVNGVEYVRVVKTGNNVIIRTYSAGVHVGELLERRGKEVKLRNAYRIWRWRGANTLSELSQKGLQSAEESGYTRVSEPVPEILLTEAIEVIPMTQVAYDSVRNAGWAK